MRQELHRLNRLDPKRANYDALLRTYNTLFIGMGVAIGKSRSTETLYRVSVINDESKPLIAKRLSAPPPHLVKGFQRCNGPGQSMFYASSRRMTALLECRVRPGDTVYLSQWMCKEPFPVNLHFDPADYLSTTRTPQAEALFSYFETSFTRRVDASFSDDYKFTAAMTEFLTRGLPSGRQLDIRADREVALRYPSVVNRDNSYNTSMPAEMAQGRLELVHVMELRVLDVVDDAVRVDVLDNGLGRTNGSIEWTGDVSKVPNFRRPEGVIFTSQGSGEWNIGLRSEHVTVAEVDKLLRE